MVGINFVEDLVGLFFRDASFGGSFGGDFDGSDGGDEKGAQLFNVSPHSTDLPSQPQQGVKGAVGRPTQAVKVAW